MAGGVPAPRQKPVQPATHPIYPTFPDRLSLRIHFLTEGSRRRERAAQLATYADATHIQTAATGESLLSVALPADRTFLFERMVEALGESGLIMRQPRSGGFAMRFGCASDDATRIVHDNMNAATFGWSHEIRARFDADIVFPVGRPRIPEDLPWDPDPCFQHILDMTERSDLASAHDATEAILPHERDVIFDEIVYLKFCIGKRLNARDLGHIARKHIRKSSISGRLERKFDTFLELLDPLLPEWSQMTQYPWNAIEHWSTFRRRALDQYHRYKRASYPRGRLFLWHPDIYAGRAGSIDATFAPYLLEAENRFRQLHGIALIGRRWPAQSALFDLVVSRFPNAVPQWSPSWLGRQSVDIFVPNLNLAIEYQGPQHYRPIEFFGGEEAFKATRARDSQKASRLARHGVILFEWRFDRPITNDELSCVLAEMGNTASTQSPDPKGRRNFSNGSPR